MNDDRRPLIDPAEFELDRRDAAASAAVPTSSVGTTT
jgi:hypothetical protein